MNFQIDIPYAKYLNFDISGLKYIIFPHRMFFISINVTERQPKTKKLA